MIYKDGLPENHFDEAAELYEIAFGEKFSMAIPNHGDRIKLIRDSLMKDYAITAFDKDRLIGIAGYHTPSGSLTGGMTASRIFKLLGIVNGIRACLIMSFYDRKPSTGELIMDGIAVHPDYRGRGIGTELLNRIVSYASENGYMSVRLDVIDTNSEARKLYERFGFRVVKKENYSLLKPVLGFGGSAIMEYEVPKELND